MLKWLKQIVSGEESGRATSAPSVSIGLLRGLEAMLDGLEKEGDGAVRKGLAVDLASYTIRGEPNSVLAELAGAPAIANHLGLRWARAERAAEAAPFWAHIAEAPPELLVRWGTALACMMRSSVHHWELEIEGDRRWLEAILVHSTGRGLYTFPGETRRPPSGLTTAVIEAALLADGASPTAWVRSLFAAPANPSWGSSTRAMSFTAMPDFAEAIHRHREVVRETLRTTAVNHRLHCAQVLMYAETATLEALADSLAVYSVSSSKQARAASEPLVLRAANATSVSLRTKAIDGAPEERLHALRLLAQIGTAHGDAELTQFVHATAAADKAASVRGLIDELAAHKAAATAVPPVELAVSLPKIDWRIPPSSASALDATLSALWSGIETEIAKHNNSVRADKAAGRRYAGSIAREFPKDAKTRLRDWLLDEKVESPPTAISEASAGTPWQQVGQAFDALAPRIDLPAVGVAKLLAFFGHLCIRENLSHRAIEMFEALHARTGRPTLLELHAIVVALGGSRDAVLRSYMSSSVRLAREWPPEDVWPLISHQLDVVTRWLREMPSDYWFDVSALFRALGTLPALPKAVEMRVFELALGTGKLARPFAQAALANAPDKEQRILEALMDGKSEVRAIAAAWLASLRAEAAVAPLETAIARERNDATRGAMLDALEALGRPVERYLDREALAKDARRGLEKGLPKEVAWLPVEALPPVAWRDGTPVPRESLLWLCVQASKAKSPEPNVLLRKYASMMQPASAEAFAARLLQAWLQEDVAPISADEANRLAANAAHSTHQAIRKYPQYYTDDPRRDLSVEELHAAYLPGFLGQPRGSAIASKGILAVVAAAGGSEVAAPAGRYLKEWFGSRAAQGKALIAMLAWVEHPSATQLMLSIGNRFRTKSFQEEAMRHAEALAERRGWTVDQLADRTMPTAGFDERMLLELSYGARTFTAHLHADLSVELRNPEGKRIASLPEPRSDDDVELAKAAKKTLSAAKRELKSISALQTDRLYEAMCTGRDWPAEDWTTFLLPHPVVRLLLQRLVWIEVGADGSERMFRPLDDGTLTDVADDRLELHPSARVRLAHDSRLDGERIAAWQRHLADYEVKPLFQQLGKGSFRLPPERARSSEIDEFKGHLLEAFALRGRATKLGYVRGTTEDGGWFSSYEKRFPTLGITAVIAFTGNPVPETNRTVALLTLSFTRSVGSRIVALALGDVPPVLLSECWSDLRACAAEGTGFDPDWQSKSEYR